MGEQGYSDVNYPTKKVWKNTGYEYDLVLTNKEVRLMFQQMVKSWFSGIKISYNEFIKALLAGNFMRKKETNTNQQLTRVALYIRVSGEEQKIKGLSLEAQQERLEQYAKERAWLIVGVYIDAAKTARKNMHKRTEFQRMIEAVKHDEIIEEYRKDYQIYTSTLNQLQEPVDEKPPNFSAVEVLPQNNFKELYEMLTHEYKCALWRSAIKEIRIDRENKITGISFG